jgi:acylphosphatase
MEKINEMISRELKKLMEKNPAILGWSNNIKDGKIRVYISEEKAVASLVKSLKVGEEEYPIEYYKIGKIRALGG